jgi:hypothetical protein
MENQEQDSPKPELSIADLQNLRTLLDVATRRGAFGASEMTSVGAVFDRVNTFLNAVAPAEKTEESDTQA